MLARAYLRLGAIVDAYDAAEEALYFSPRYGAFKAPTPAEVERLRRLSSAALAARRDAVRAGDLLRGRASNVVYVVDDAARKHAIGADEAVQRCGYAPGTVQVVPDALLAELETGAEARPC